MNKKAAVSNTNIISKLGFAIFGRFDASEPKELQSFLIKESNRLKEIGRPSTTRQTIYKWFKEADIKRPASFQFIWEVLSDLRASDEWVSLPDDQKKAANRVRSFCKKNFTVRSRTVVRERHDGIIVIKSDDIFRSGASKDEMDYFVGSYKVVKTRSGPEKNDFLSIEYFEIENVSGSLCVQWWFLLDGEKLGSFDGVITFQGDWLWCMLHSPSLGGRFRMVCLPRKGWGRVQDELRGGLILSTSPHPSRSVPVSTRIVTEATTPLGTDADRKRSLGHLSSHRFEHDRKTQIMAFLTEAAALPGRLDASIEILEDTSDPRV